MARLNYKPYFPKNDPHELFETKFKDFSETELKKWNNFKNRITKSEFIKGLLVKKQSNICPICSKSINGRSQVVHHTDYDQLCEYESYLTLSSPTNKNRKIKVPHCENCPTSNVCINKVILIHNVCHMILHKQEGRINKIDKGIEKISFPKKKRIQPTVPKRYWVDKSSQIILNIVDELLKFINKLSQNELFSVAYNKYYIELFPENIVYFKPENNQLKITISYGNFDKWLLKLEESNISSNIIKRKSYRLTFSIDDNQFKKYKELIKEIITDNYNQYKSGNEKEYSPQASQLSLF